MTPSKGCLSSSGDCPRSNLEIGVRARKMCRADHCRCSGEKNTFSVGGGWRRWRKTTRAVGQSAGGELGEACSKLVIVGQHNKIGHENMITVRGISSQSLQGSWAFPAEIRGRQRASGCMCNHPCLLPLLIYHHHKPEIRPRPRISLAYFP